ncbi:MAG TPA: arylesterase [Gemmatimonadales bacterium]|nr:arylesterase [Gemmatimonadales bacterium]
MISRSPLVLAVAILTGCEESCDLARERSEAPARMPPADRAAVLFLGTSLTAGYGLDPDQAYPALLQRKIDSAGLPYRVVNAGVSGETSAGAVRRLGWLLRQPFDVLVIETGGNDGLRGLSTDSLRANIQTIIDSARALSPPPRIVLLGMRALPNYGFGYARRFRKVYEEVAGRNDIPLVPFLLDGVAGEDGMNQADGIHPTPEGHRRMAETVWEALQPVLEDGQTIRRPDGRTAGRSGG